LKLHPLLRKCGKFAVVKVQRTPIYRKLVSRFLQNVRIGEASEKDRIYVHSWWDPDFPEKSVPLNPHVTEFVAKKKSKIVGFIQLVRRAEESGAESGHWLFSLFVKPMYRSAGIGEALSQEVIEWARKEGAEELRLLVHEDNWAAIKLYQKLGFKLKVIKGLEELLEREKSITGRKRVVMGKAL